MIRSPLVRTLLASVALSAAIVLSGCNTDGVLPMSEKAARPLPERLVKEIESKNMDKESPILVRLFKEESELEVWKQDREGRFSLLKTYPICRWSGELGPKIKEGDRQAPEGFYTITPGQMNPNSQYYLSFDLGYPNAFDRAHGRTGAQLMVHGDCSSRGCYSMTDEQISEIYALGRDSFFGGQKSFQVQAYPFRMTPQNLAKHRSNPHIAFWKMLKKGNDHFEVTRIEPKVNVCDKRYVFDAYMPGDLSRSPSFSAAAKCPAFEVPEEIASAVQEKQQRDEAQYAELVRYNTPLAPIKTNADGGMHPVFVAAVKRNQIGVPPSGEFLLTSTAPGTIPATVRPPRIPELADSLAVAGAAPSAHPAGEIAPPQMAMAEPGAPTGQPSAKGGSFFGSLFSTGSSKTDTKPEAKTETKSDGALNRMARLIGFGGAEAKTETTPPAATPKPKPAAKPTQVPGQAPAQVASHGAIRPKPAAAEPAGSAPSQPSVATATPAAPAPVRTPAQVQQAQAQWPPAPAQAPATSAMSGAAPVVPAGNFDNRWSAFR